MPIDMPLFAPEYAIQDQRMIVTRLDSGGCQLASIVMWLAASCEQRWLPARQSAAFQARVQAIVKHCFKDETCAFSQLIYWTIYMARCSVQHSEASSNLMEGQAFNGMHDVAIVSTCKLRQLSAADLSVLSAMKHQRLRKSLL